ncbi:uncharacterized protein LOC106137651 isoform X1 [Amyelois transitella]|uniref:uncharacterized protein LOC106137651 isoform X1 n=2 Tax=Amyelois transitella TaxID=680683 RepID=UPI00298F471A|nr:uncharacterized protein LOC106137651 isoform X1 [Amyelois transitella]
MYMMNTLLTNSKEDPVNDKVKSIVKTVLERCHIEKTQNALVVPLNAIEERTTFYTAFPIKYVWDLQEESNKLPPVINLNVRQKVQLLNYFKDLYALRKPFTFSQVAEIFTKTGIEINDPSFLRKQMYALGYESRSTTCGTVIVEIAKLRFERYLYLSKVIRFRNNNIPICYIDIRVIDKNLKFEEFSLMPNYDKSMNRLYFLHALSRSGIVNGIFSNVIDREIFTKWLTEILVTKLQPNSVLILNNSDFFNEKIKPITRYDTKLGMLQWLEKNDIPCSSNMTKPELYELISKSRIKSCDYKIDNALKAMGHNVLRIPEKFQDLTPTELLWNNLRNEEYNNLKIIEIKNTVETYIEKIEKLKWELFSDAVANWEKEIFEIDSVTEDFLDTFVFDTDYVHEPSSNTSLPEQL